MSGNGCHIRDVYYRGLGYANPTVKSWRKMVLVCEKYALEFIFNGSKSQLFLFGVVNMTVIFMYVCRSVRSYCHIHEFLWVIFNATLFTKFLIYIEHLV